ncbi:MAG: glutamate--cysteine ligase [Bacteriovoracaceae bacterium]|nr:glutamate--cysteine ligase [Bacteriovoracaceae bacterium]
MTNNSETPKIHTKESLFEFVINNWNECNSFIDKYFTLSNTPFYTSVDIREANHKLAPVDNNQYPAGFNNLCQKDSQHASNLVKKFLEDQKSEENSLALIPESHTSNLYYLDHLAALIKIFNMAGKEVTIISPDQEFLGGKDFIELTSFSGHPVKIYSSAINNEGYFCLRENPATSFHTVILNHDQSKPLPVDWNKITSKIFPTSKMGWYQRQKNQHFQLYQKVANEFAHHFSLDPDLIQAKFRAIDHVDFLAKEGLENLAKQFEDLQKEITHPNAKIFMKASQGTYGMGISVIDSADEILNMNRKIRNKMDVGKNNLKFNQVLLQEGVETIVTHEGSPAEITLYLVGGKTAGGFMRTNSQKDAMSNLNSKGMTYEKFCVCEIQQGNQKQAKLATYSLLARLSSAATALETMSVK